MSTPEFPISPEQVDPDAPGDGESLIPRDFMDLGPIERRLRKMANRGERRRTRFDYELDEENDDV